ncbi:helix-turn-helix domain-containing protein [Mucilaginibacter sp.]|uniref:winged helix-turn-helix transcriptional regulator n=1 Tax=Mucilaginibacter sp. TaxID=1882438 RepID=UPI0026299F71|nr:helix-turn-helix domain-containing protein [Mucilaginibacter sp.]MDB4918410.1 transcriptional regulator, HxlR family [Mucilaginibacter sp.]
MKDLANQDEDTPVSNCRPSLKAIDDALYVIGGKWKLKIIVMLFDGSKRFNDLQKSISGISARILSNELKALELNCFVSRTVHDGAPLAVEYALTSYSRSLRTVVHALDEWGTQHREMIRFIP